MLSWSWCVRVGQHRAVRRPADVSHSSWRRPAARSTLGPACTFPGAAAEPPWDAAIQCTMRMGPRGSCLFSPPRPTPTGAPPASPPRIRATRMQEAKAAAELEVQPGLLELLAYLRDSQVCVGGVGEGRGGRVAVFFIPVAAGGLQLRSGVICRRVRAFAACSSTTEQNTCPPPHTHARARAHTPISQTIRANPYG